ncbi:hypothetical protein GG804_16885 [Sphingomonas histidinilytica]|jgi:hypothetical protein|uniref:Uncharacterized protein n=1 Tax=Rhizorhabdus histidinilytica TaxID=439228 RepID=A0A1T5G0A4_9SPHN|nr:hypothetical protein [Rhizorhabdus histidinilytica]MBO9378445.1 hypothetical protein [Rhizorhabdus histidinilytica]QEH81476.1 hypothetical protein EIK56_26670 [Sphingomonas sp. C8-2]SKC01767.1 hypothetical protein SAMN06295920_111110 [Rhizorhabdus histidinilytica]
MDLLNVIRSDLRVGEAMAAAAAATIADRRGIAAIPAVTRPDRVEPVGEHPRRPLRATARRLEDEDEGETPVEPTPAPNLYTADAALKRTDRGTGSRLDLFA